MRCGVLAYNFAVTAAIAPWFDPHLSLGMRQLLSSMSFYVVHLAPWSVRQRAEREQWSAAFRNRMFLAPSAFAAITSLSAHRWRRRLVYGKFVSKEVEPTTGILAGAMSAP